MMKRKTITLLFALLGICLGIEAQNTATVKSFVMKTDHIPVSDRRVDLNGNPCALVKVQVVDEI